MYVYIKEERKMKRKETKKKKTISFPCFFFTIDHINISFVRLI